MLLEAAEAEQRRLRDEIDEAYLKSDGGLEARIKAGMLRGLKVAFGELPKRALERLASAATVTAETVGDVRDPAPSDPYA